MFGGLGRRRAVVASRFEGGASYEPKSERVSSLLFCGLKVNLTDPQPLRRCLQCGLHCSLRSNMYSKNCFVREALSLRGCFWVVVLACSFDSIAQIDFPEGEKKERKDAKACGKNSLG